MLRKELNEHYLASLASSHLYTFTDAGDLGSVGTRVIVLGNAKAKNLLLTVCFGILKLLRGLCDASKIEVNTIFCMFK